MNINVGRVISSTKDFRRGGGHRWGNASGGCDAVKCVYVYGVNYSSYRYKVGGRHPEGESR